jgi:hypothetical protein
LSNSDLLTNSPAAVTSDGIEVILPSFSLAMMSWSILFAPSSTMDARSTVLPVQIGSIPAARTTSGSEFAWAGSRS